MSNCLSETDKGDRDFGVTPRSLVCGVRPRRFNKSVLSLCRQAAGLLFFLDESMVRFLSCEADHQQVTGSVALGAGQLVAVAVPALHCAGVRGEAITVLFPMRVKPDPI